MLNAKAPYIKLFTDLIDGNARPMAQSECMPETKALDGEECTFLSQSLVISDPETNEEEGQDIQLDR